MTAPERAEIVIIGAGIQGLLLAFNLADRGQGGIVVLDAGYCTDQFYGRCMNNGAHFRFGSVIAGFYPDGFSINLCNLTSTGTGFYPLKIF